jgi:8-oxo-dGTP pyrophosphatase MutT (NUDIX family)
MNMRFKNTDVKQIRGSRVALWQNGLLLVQTDLRLEAAEQFYRLPGGRMEADEAPAECAAREFQEEIGLPVRIGALWYVGENLYLRRGRPVQEIIFYFQGSTETPLPEGDPIATRESHLSAVLLPPSRLMQERCLPPRLFARLLEDGSEGPRQIAYIREGGF